MILDQLGNYRNHTTLSARIAKALEYLTALSAKEFAPGRKDLETDKVFALHQVYRTERPENLLFETHRKYIDVQYVLDGREIIRYADAEGLQEDIPYDGVKDIAFFKPAEGTDCRMKSADFAVFFPSDGHMPKISVDGSELVKKVVVKIAARYPADSRSLRRFPAFPSIGVAASAHVSPALRCRAVSAEMVRSP